MKIKALTVQGFRGFNSLRSIDFNDRLTLIYAPNSYGKTSISESFEWLIYGSTSKVEKALSKTEFKGSYRNLHFPSDKTAFVQVRFSSVDGEIVFTSELISPDGYRRFVGEGEEKIEVDNWHLGYDLYDVPKPFVLQHALQYLLMAKPDERFQGFARLLGFEVLDEIHKDVISLCTKPQLPDEVVNLQDRISVLRVRIDEQTSLSSISKEFKKKKKSILDIYEVVFAECMNRVPPDTKEESILPQLLKVREEEVAKVFKGHITHLEFSDDEGRFNQADEEYFLTYLTEDFINEYTSLIALSTLQEVIQRERFLDFGINILGVKPKNCPFCGQAIDDSIIQHVHDEHKTLMERTKPVSDLKSKRIEVINKLTSVLKRLDSYHSRYSSKLASFLEIKSSLGTLENILSPRHQAHFLAINSAVSALQDPNQVIKKSYKAVSEKLEAVVTSVEKSEEDSELMKSFSTFLTDYLSKIHSLNDLLAKHASAISEADQVLQHELDMLAGTEEVSILIDLLELRNDIEKYIRIEAVVSSLSELRKSVDDFVANKIIQSIASDLTDEVMRWYNKIKTTGDPDVHFDGFDLERTKTGKVKSRRVQIKAASYGEELVSAVSSLSESKLNALGLCMSLAINLSGDSPFDFILIDDPIQSLDSEHETQFIEIIRELVESFSVQLIILSHNKSWLDQVCAGCRALNGWYYEITGYTKEGPHIVPISWARWKERLKLVDAIANDPKSSTLKLQQAEEEIRIVISDLTSELYLKERRVQVSPHKLNSAKVQKILTGCGVESSLVDRIVQTFGTTDDSHHAPAKYVPERERIKRYHSWAHELSRLL